MKLVQLDDEFKCTICELNNNTQNNPANTVEWKMLAKKDIEKIAKISSLILWKLLRVERLVTNTSGSLGVVLCFGHLSLHSNVT